MWFMCFKWEEAISTLSGRALKLIDKFTYPSSNIFSTESEVNIRLVKAWTAIGMISIKWKSDLSDKIKWGFFQVVVVSVLLYGCTSWTQNAHMELHKNATCCFEQILEAAPHKTPALRPVTSLLTNHTNKTSKIREAFLKKKERTHKWRSSMKLQNMDVPVMADQHKLSSALCGHWI